MSPPPIELPESGPPAPFELVVFGSSAGGITTLLEILPELPAGFPIPIVVVQHLPADKESQLPELLGSRSKLRCKWAETGERPGQGCIYVAPPGSNLIFNTDRRFQLLQGFKPPLGWPSVDMFLGGVAEHLGKRAIAVILSGMLHDGAEGMLALRRRGGVTIAQRPATAASDEMPCAAIDLGRAELTLAPFQIVEGLQILATCGVEQ